MRSSNESMDNGLIEEVILRGLTNETFPDISVHTISTSIGGDGPFETTHVGTLRLVCRSLLRELAHWIQSNKSTHMKFYMHVKQATLQVGIMQVIIWPKTL